jgi:uncharacterized protein (TIGR03066 family)
MTEDEWVRAEEDAIWRAAMALRPRRQRLLASAMVRSLGRGASDSVVVAALEANDRFADTGKTKAALKRARQSLADARVALAELSATGERSILGGYMAMFAAAVACSENATAGTVREVVLAWREAEKVSKAEARRRAYPVFREVAGPDTLPAFSPSWRTDTAVLIAKQMYDSREFSAMPILADALQDAGCDNDEVLNHCRDANQVHVRGCWVVDLVLGSRDVNLRSPPPAGHAPYHSPGPLRVRSVNNSRRSERMKSLCAAALGLAVFFVAAPAKADDADKLLGKWEVTKSGGETPMGTIVEFAKDGKMTAIVNLDGKDVKLTGTYTLKDKKLAVKLKLDDQDINHDFTIKFPTDDSLELEDKDKKIDTLKKKK